MLSLYLLTAAHAGAPQSIAVSYTTTFDLSAAADKVCAQTGLCDCTVRYEGSGTLVEEQGDRWTYQGSYSVAEGSCHDALMLWVPTDGQAFHTVRTASGDTTITEWIAHDAREATTRFTSRIKEQGQVYLYDLSASIHDGVVTHTESESGRAGPMTMKSTHQLVLKLE